MSKYAEGKEKAIEEAKKWQRSFVEGRSYTWTKIFNFTTHFTKLAKRYGLIKEFRENGII